MKSRRKFLKLAGIGTMLAASPIMTKAAATGGRMVGPKRFLEACSDGKLETVRQLLQGNPQFLSAKDKEGKSGFALALLFGHQAVAAHLTAAGYQSDLHESVLALDWDRFEMLIGEASEESAARINADHPIGGCGMWAAAAGGAGADSWRVYAKCGDPNCNPRKAAGTTALQKALRFPDLKTAEITAASLLSNDAQPAPLQNADKSPLHIAAERGSGDLVEMLIRLGAEVQRRDQDGITAQELAEKLGHQEVSALLRQHQEIPRTCRTSRIAYTATGQAYELPDIGDIPLDQQLQLVGQAHGNLEYVQKAVAADPRIVHSMATTSERAVEACAHTGRKPIVDLLLSHGAPYSLPTAVMLNDHTTVKRYLDEDPNRIHERGAHDFALLWYPVIGGADLEMTQLLLNQGAQVEQQHYLGTTALHWACMRGPAELVELLVDHGAEVNRIGRKFKAEGQTPLQLTKDEKIAGFLRSRGAR